MPKAVVEEHYFNAFQILLSSNWFSVNTCDVYDEREFPLYTKIPNPETLYIKNEAFEELSNEAKEIIISIVSCPEEMLIIFKTKKRKLFSKKVARTYYRKKWKSKFIVDMAFKEITRFVKTL